MLFFFFFEFCEGIRKIFNSRLDTFMNALFWKHPSQSRECHMHAELKIENLQRMPVQCPDH